MRGVKYKKKPFDRLKAAKGRSVATCLMQRTHPRSKEFSARNCEYESQKRYIDVYAVDIGCGDVDAFHRYEVRSWGVSTDSIVFLSAADNILHNARIYVSAYGMNAPLTHFPPLYPLLLAVVSQFFQISPEQSAKIAGSILFGANLFLSGVILVRVGGEKTEASDNIRGGIHTATKRNAVFAVIILAMSEYMITIHCKVFTEPLFITFMLLSFIYLEKYSRTLRLSAVTAAGAMVALACLTRYAGIVLLPIGIAHLRQLARSALFVFLPNSLLDDIKSPSGMTVLAIAASLCGLIALFAAYMSRHLKKKSFNEILDSIVDMSPMLKVAVLFLCAYPLFLACSISFADYTTPLSYRIMLPEYVVGFPLLIFGSLEFSDALLLKRKKLFSLILKIVVTLTLASYAFRAAALCSVIHSNGLGYSSRNWRNSKLVAYLRNIPRKTVIYTNGSAGVFYQTKRVAKTIPRKYVNGKPNPKYSTLLTQMRDDIEANGGVVVYFNDVPSSLIPSVEELKKELNMRTALKANLGTALRRLRK